MRTYNQGADLPDDVEGEMGWLIDYIDALVKALRETDAYLQHLDRVGASSGSTMMCEKLTHTNRHLLDDGDDTAQMRADDDGMQ